MKFTTPVQCPSLPLSNVPVFLSTKMNYGLVLRNCVITGLAIFALSYFLIPIIWTGPNFYEKAFRINKLFPYLENMSSPLGKMEPISENDDQRSKAWENDQRSLHPVQVTKHDDQRSLNDGRELPGEKSDQWSDIRTSSIPTVSLKGPAPRDMEINSIRNAAHFYDDYANFRSEYNQLTCRFPLLDPWDSSILPFLSTPQPLFCPRVQRDLTYVDSKGRLRWNETEYSIALSIYGNISCFYRQFDKLDDNDHSVMYVNGGTTFTPSISVPLKYENVEVKCHVIDQKTGRPSLDKEIYWQVHAYTLLSNSSLREANDQSLSVLLFVVDSLSISAFRRHLPLTYDYLRHVMRFHTFLGHHKIGDNSFPNHVAMLLGKRVVDEHWPDMMDEVKENYKQIRFDHWPLIWKLFAEKGYETGFNEDAPDWGLFHYFSRGFAKKPVDHYYHQYWIVVNRGDRKSQRDCYGNKAKLDVQLDLIRRHLTSGRNRKLFQYVSATGLFHKEEGYETQKADPHLLRFFKEMYDGGYFNNTAIVFVSDHGHRYASLRRTLVGMIEERLPMLNIWFPQWFYKGNDINSTLHSNTIRLTSQFDIHETMLDILHNNYRGTQRSTGSRGLSLLYPIPRDRTCSQAGIPDHYCTCVQAQSLPVNDSTAVSAVLVAMNHVNSLLTNLSQCSQLRVEKILHVEQLAVNEQVARGVSDMKSAQEFESKSNEGPVVRSMNKLRVTFMTEPGKALFEATTAKTPWKSDWEVEGRVYRLNSYHNTSWCVNEKFLFNYCICKERK